MIRMQRIERATYSKIAKLTVPIILQNLLSAAVNSADVVMLNYIGQEHISAVSLAANYANILFIVLYGLGTGVTMLSAQYFGKGDMRAVNAVEGIALRFSVSVGMLFAAAAVCAPEWMMRAFTPEPELIRIGAEDPDAGYDDEGASGMQPDESGWLCFTYEFISLPTEKENREIIIAYAFADINMNHVMEQRRSFLSNSILLIVLLTAAAIVIGMLVVRRIAVKPLRLLRQGTLDFAEKKAGETGDTIYTMDDVMNLKIPNRDEIGDLYQGIREMQASIVHNTEELARNAAERERARQNWTWLQKSRFPRCRRQIRISPAIPPLTSALP